MYEMKKSDLVTRFPTETAELLIYLCNSAPGYHATDISTIARRLPPLDPEFRRRLDESMARVGIDVWDGTLKLLSQQVSRGMHRIVPTLGRCRLGE